ncbi:MAG: tRNA pseudouridine(55) synthase, partial [Lentimicrobium sp.]|nr:tRNA pseudouridine(55) synthase [Lentimicrobium sp.]
SVKIPQVNFRIRCSKGTYIRALANDFGKALNSGAYLSSLCRSAIGHFKLEEALSINEFKERYKNPEEEW